MRLSVAILCEYPTLNGGERSMLACVERFDSAEIDVTFLAPPNGPLADELQRRSVRHIPFDLHAASGRASRDDSVRRLGEACRDFDVLHANSLAMGRLTGAAVAHLPCRATAHLRDIIKLSPAAVADLNGNSRLIAVSYAVRDFHVAQGVDPDRVAVNHNGIDVSAFQDSPGASIRQELSLPESAFVVAAIGQICLRKGQDTF
ncbi:MAG: glycosyltransferase family 4 protein, partial [Planctomycetaceae bacterium]|nr:glycosyltransferase family 4 protein [Planctomycetaceae bacterium]